MYEYADEEVENEGETANIVTEKFKNINLEISRGRRTSLPDCETAWKEETFGREVKDPINFSVSSAMKKL